MEGDKNDGLYKFKSEDGFWSYMTEEDKIRGEKLRAFYQKREEKVRSIPKPHNVGEISSYDFNGEPTLTLYGDDMLTGRWQRELITEDGGKTYYCVMSRGDGPGPSWYERVELIDGKLSVKRATSSEHNDYISIVGKRGQYYDPGKLEFTHTPQYEEKILNSLTDGQ